MKWSPIEHDGTTAPWRAEILLDALRLVFAVGAVAAAVSVAYSLAVGELAIAIADTVGISLLAVLALAPQLSYRHRSLGFLTLLYGLGLFLIFNVGLAAHVYLLAFSALTALLMGLRAGLVAVAINAITLVSLAVIADTGPTVTMGDLGTTSARLVVIANFVFVSFMLTLTCATLLRRVESGLHEQRLARLDAQRLARALEQTSDVILLADPTGHIEYTNRAHQMLLERFGSVARFDHLDQLAPDTVGDDTPTRTAHRTGEWTGHLMFDRPASDHDRAATVEFDAWVEAIHDEHGRVINLVGSMDDCTATRSLERRLRQAEKLAAMGTLASGVAHNFNNVITTILGYAEHITEHDDDEQRRSDAGVIVEACDRARDVVRQIMVFADRASIEQTPVDVADAIREARPLLNRALGPHIELVEDLRSTSRVLVHPGGLGQALASLASNAAHAIGDRPGTVTIRATDIVADDEIARSHPTLTAGETYVTLSFSDDGVGIDPSLVDRIFDPFFTTRDPADGIGLGLAMVHAIATAAGGEVVVHSDVGVGTTFQLLLPAITTVESEHADTHPSHREENRSMPLDILLVDDEPTILEILARGLERAGHRVHRASDGQAGRDRFDADPDAINVLVTDLTMPGLGGIELIDHVRASRPDLPVVLTTGFGHDRAATLESLGLTAYLVKPFSHTDLLAVLGRLADPSDGRPDAPPAAGRVRI